ncbi:tetratricopeptide repeat protein [Saccharothrix deserti]|uniref:tetratricopeptide repeat protein n=1 Tax=Saccharothrix deserti TaxID=2593674 RepID=UPI00131E6268|nr:tetratricopeptide repeat protein [Saccharothrix deserti]
MLTTIVGLTGGVGAALIAAWATTRGPGRRKSRVKLVDVALQRPDPAKDAKDDPPVLDVMVRNTGGQPAVLKRLVVHVHQAVRFGDTTMRMPYDAGPGHVGKGLDASATYEVELPDPEHAADAPIIAPLSQVVAPGEADRFLIRLARPFVLDLVAYLLHLEILYDEKGRKVRSDPLAVVYPQRIVIASIEEIRREIRGFQRSVAEIRQAIDREMAARSRSAPDWLTAPPRHRDDLPRGLVSVEGNGNIFDSGTDGVYIVNEHFWNPEQTIRRYLDDIAQRYRTVVGICTSASVLPKFLSKALPRINATLSQLPALYADVHVSPKRDTGQAPAPGGSIDVLERLIGSEALQNLRARADAGDQKAAGELRAAMGQADKIERLDAGSPESLAARETLILWRANWDVPGAAEALTELLRDQVRIVGPDHPAPLRSRHYLAKWEGEQGHAAGAVAAFAEIVQDCARVLGPDDSATLDSRSELARWQAAAGSPAEAVEAFAALVADRTRLQGSDHLRTFHARHNLAQCLGKAGRVAEAVEAFIQLVGDLNLVLGPDHPQTIASLRALAEWLEQTRRDSADDE